MSEANSQSSRCSVGYQGVKGAYSEFAAKKFFGEKCLLRPHKTFKEVFDSLDEGKIRFAVVPVRNSVTGGIREVMDLLFEREIRVTGEVTLKIEHVLVSLPEAELKDIKYVYSHPEALAQCKRFLKERNWVVYPSYDTAGSVLEIKRRKLFEAAAIASEYAAKLYDMKILLRSIQDSKDNYTKFYVLSKEEKVPEDSDTTSVIFITEHVPGALYRALGAFAERNINLLHIESRPIRDQPWNYSFYIDFEGSLNDQKIKDALKDLKKRSVWLKILGSYKSH